SSGGSQTPTKISSSQAKSIASGFIEEDGAYVSNVKDDGSMYICYISDANGEVVDAIGISYSGENLGKV
ncbi:MAG: peptidase propeptide domain-containing protein, partial [Methanobrevibacter sp.]|nr:peptidase propeptide domain-containing protein [Methanobrevibacter sp.]